MIKSAEIGGVKITGIVGETGFHFGGDQIISGLDNPDVRIDIKNRGNNDGVNVGNYFHGKRSITLEFQIYGKDCQDYVELRRLMSSVFSIDNGFQKIVFTTIDDIQVAADVIIEKKLESAYKHGHRNFSEVRVVLVADSHLLSAVVDPATIDPTSPFPEMEQFCLPPVEGGGYAITFGIPFSIGNGGDGAETIINTGNTAASPIIRITGPLQSGAITNVTSGKSFTIDHILTTSANIIEINTEAGTVIVDGNTNILGDFTGDFWTLAPGDNVVRFTAVGSAQSTQACLYWSNSFSGI